MKRQLLFLLCSVFGLSACDLGPLTEAFKSVGESIKEEIMKEVVEEIKDELPVTKNSLEFYQAVKAASGTTFADHFCVDLKIESGEFEGKDNKVFCKNLSEKDLETIQSVCVLDDFTQAYIFESKKEDMWPYWVEFEINEDSIIITFTELNGPVVWNYYLTGCDLDSANARMDRYFEELNYSDVEKYHYVDPSARYFFNMGYFIIYGDNCQEVLDDYIEHLKTEIGEDHFAYNESTSSWIDTLNNFEICLGNVSEPKSERDYSSFPLPYIWSNIFHITEE